MKRFFKKHGKMASRLALKRKAFLAAFCVFFLMVSMLALLPSDESAPKKPFAISRPAYAVEESSPIQFRPQVGIPGSTKFGTNRPSTPISGSTIADYIKDWHKFGVAVLGILAVVMIMAGGFKWLTAAGKSEVISNAKKTIFSAFVGLLLALGSYTILNMIDVSLVQFKPLVVTKVERRPLELDVRELRDQDEDCCAAGATSSGSATCCRDIFRSSDSMCMSDVVVARHICGGTLGATKINWTVNDTEYTVIKLPVNWDVTDFRACFPTWWTSPEDFIAGDENEIENMLEDRNNENYMGRDVQAVKCDPRHCQESGCQSNWLIFGVDH